MAKILAFPDKRRSNQERIIGESPVAGAGPISLADGEQRNVESLLRCGGGGELDGMLGILSIMAEKTELGSHLYNCSRVAIILFNLKKNDPRKFDALRIVEAKETIERWTNEELRNFLALCSDNDVKRKPNFIHAIVELMTERGIMF